MCLLLSVGLFSACSSDDDGNPFIGKWKLMMIEDGDSITICSGDNKIIAFYFSGYLEGFEQKATYNYDDQFLYYNFSIGSKLTFNYSFDENHILRIKLIKINDAENYKFFFAPSDDPLSPQIGKTQVFRRTTN